MQFSSVSFHDICCQFKINSFFQFIWRTGSFPRPPADSRKQQLLRDSPKHPEFLHESCLLLLQKQAASPAFYLRLHHPVLFYRLISFANSEPLTHWFSSGCTRTGHLSPRRWDGGRKEASPAHQLLSSQRSRRAAFQPPSSDYWHHQTVWAVPGNLAVGAALVLLEPLPSELAERTHGRTYVIWHKTSRSC